MSSFETAYNWMMDNEDAARAYKRVPDTCPKGCGEGPCFAIAGINSGAFPLSYLQIESIPQAERGPRVQSFYQANFWSNWFAQLESDEVAKRVFDMAVNGGEGTAVKLLQRACNCLSVGGPIIDEDGKWGPKTLDAANSTYERGTVVDAFRNAREDYYEDIVAASPDKEKYLKAWIARAMK